MALGAAGAGRAHGPLARVQRLWGHGDRLWQLVIASTAVLVLGLALAIGVLLWQQSELARAAFGLGFLAPGGPSTWNPVAGRFAAWPFVYGTLLTSLIAVVCAAPISLGVAIFLAELCPRRLRAPLGTMVELLAAVPSVVYGLWGIFVFLPSVVAPLGRFLAATLGAVPALGALFAGPVPASGASRLAAGLVLAIMITPTVSAVTRDVLLAVPHEQREGALALGATHWEAISGVLLPYGLSGILGAFVLGLGRALGETMAVTMVVGNSIAGSPSLLSPGYTLSSVIANEFAEAVTPLHSAALIELGLVLFVITLVLNLVARLMVWNVGRRARGEVRA